MRNRNTHLFSGSLSLLLVLSALNADENLSVYEEIESESPESNKGKDDQLTLHAQNTLRGGAISVGYENVKVNIVDGHATITGYVENDSARKDVIRRIQDIDGILDIKNLLSLNGMLSSKDHQLTVRARDTLKGGAFSKAYNNIAVNVQNGRAIVAGTIENDNDQNDIFKRILAIEDIKGIDNQLKKR